MQRQWRRKDSPDTTSCRCKIDNRALHHCFICHNQWTRTQKEEEYGKNGNQRCLLSLHVAMRVPLPYGTQALKASLLETFALSGKLERLENLRKTFHRLASRYRVYPKKFQKMINSLQPTEIRKVFLRKELFTLHQGVDVELLNENHYKISLIASKDLPWEVGR